MQLGHERLDVYQVALGVDRWAARQVIPAARKQHLRDQLVGCPSRSRSRSHTGTGTDTGTATGAGAGSSSRTGTTATDSRKTP